jgi:hypothetical protein
LLTHHMHAVQIADSARVSFQIMHISLPDVTGV